MICLKRFDSNEWAYVGEGNANIVIRYTGTDHRLIRKVLRIKKDELFTQDDATFSQEFIEKIMAKLLGNEYIVRYELVQVTRDFLNALACSIQPKRPLFRLKKNINCNSTVAIILEDLTQQWPTTLTVELKPKWGFKPYSRFIKNQKLKAKHCRFCMHSYYRNLDIGEYCPLDLYSKDDIRVQRALKALLKYPDLEKTCKISLNGTRISNDGTPNIQQDELRYALKEILVRDPILTKLQTLQQKLDAWDIEGIISIYGNHKQPDMALWENTVRCYLTNLDNDETENDIQRLYEYVLSMTFKDCSLLINMRQTNEINDLQRYIKIQDQVYIEYDIRVIDVDVKSIDKIPYWFQLDKSIVEHALKTNFNKICQ